jgi:hypothetical protein
MVARAVPQVRLSPVCSRQALVLRALHLLGVVAVQRHEVIMAARVVGAVLRGLLALQMAHDPAEVVAVLVIILWVIRLSLGPLLVPVRAA